jgi:glycosyltransferase involved in cell wall biosynthesis
MSNSGDATPALANDITMSREVASRLVNALESRCNERKYSLQPMRAEEQARLLCLMHLPPPIHGVTIVNQSVASSRHLRDQFDVEVVALRFTDSISDISRFSVKKLTRALRTGLELTRRLVHKRPAAVYFTLSLHGGAFVRDCLYVAIVKGFGVQLVYHLHGQLEPKEIQPRWQRILLGWAFRGAWVIHLSPLLAEQARDLVPPARALHVPNGIADVGTSRVVARSGPPRILYLANMIEEKGPLILLRALAVLRDQGVPFCATFAGAPAKDGCLDRFNKELNRSGLQDVVSYVGPAYDDDKFALFASHDVFACPTYRDAFPLVVLEAMQHGLPIVATVEGAIPEMIDDGKSGFLVPKRDIAAFASSLRLLLGSVERRREMGLRARERYVANFTLDRFEQNLTAALRRAMREDQTR